MTMPAATEQSGARRKTAPYLVDCDLHLAPEGSESITRFLPKQLDAYATQYLRTYQPEFYPRRSELGARLDAWPPSGLQPGADFDFVRDQHLDAWHIDIGIITPTEYQGVRNLELGAALAHAVNEWQIEAWIERDPRLRGSIVVTMEYPEAAAREIERYAGDKRFAQVFTSVGTHEPAGRRKYWKIYEAAERCGFPVAMHYGNMGGGGAPTGVGFPSFYVEDHAGGATMFQDQVTSLAFEGVFQQFPALDVVLVEGGFTWLPPLMWRLDRAWHKLGGEVPHVDRLPSEVLRERLWYTSQPMEEPTGPDEIYRILDELGDGQLLFSTDYPHWDFDSPDNALPSRLSPEAKRRIFGENACRLYGWTIPREAGDAKVRHRTG
jgi:uncharacterized protein